MINFKNSSVKENFAGDQILLKSSTKLYALFHTMNPHKANLDNKTKKFYPLENLCFYNILTHIDEQFYKMFVKLHFTIQVVHSLTGSWYIIMKGKPRVFYMQCRYNLVTC